MIRTREELETVIREPTGATPTRNVWIHESLEDEARRVWERYRPSESSSRFRLPDPFDHAVLAGGGFFSTSLILRPEPSQGAFQFERRGALRSGIAPRPSMLAVQSLPNVHRPAGR